MQQYRGQIYLQIKFNARRQQWWTDLCNHLPWGGAILTGLDAKVPPHLQDIDDGLGWDVEAGGPAHFQLAGRKLLKD